ncbi:hypothetical protein [Brevundimonas sp.]|uniref:hypothetical protein n=1 Tax=Brevundimonas sp. TaxID=1871086 RepID=UPI00286A48BC|nr:hypothetical protein [Brevundimonas sp.]
MAAARIVGGTALLLSGIVACFVLVALEMFGGPTGGYSALHPAMLVVLLAPLLGLALVGAAALKRVSPRLILIVTGLPLLCQAVVFFSFVRTGALA